MFFIFFNYFYSLYLEGGEQPSPSLSGTTERDPCRHSWAALSGNRIYRVHTHQHQLHTPHPPAQRMPCESPGTWCPFPCQNQKLAQQWGQCEGHVNRRCCLLKLEKDTEQQDAEPRSSRTRVGGKLEASLQQHALTAWLSVPSW